MKASELISELQRLVLKYNTDLDVVIADADTSWLLNVTSVDFGQRGQIEISGDYGDVVDNA